MGWPEIILAVTLIAAGFFGTKKIHAWLRSLNRPKPDWPDFTP